MVEREKAIDLLCEVRNYYIDNGKITETQLVDETYDAHILFRLSAKPEELVVVTAYPRISTNFRLKVKAKIMDYYIVMEGLRNKVTVAHACVRRLSNFPNVRSIPYNERILRASLEEDISELR